MCIGSLPHLHLRKIKLNQRIRGTWIPVKCGEAGDQVEKDLMDWFNTTLPPHSIHSILYRSHLLGPEPASSASTDNLNAHIAQLCNVGEP
jgi:hypothetical protein